MKCSDCGAVPSERYRDHCPRCGGELLVEVAIPKLPPPSLLPARAALRKCTEDELVAARGVLLVMARIYVPVGSTIYSQTAQSLAFTLNHRLSMLRVATGWDLPVVTVSIVGTAIVIDWEREALP